MKKVIATLTLCFMIAGINTEIEALRKISKGVKGITQKVGDLAMGRKTDTGTQSLDYVVNSIRGLGSNFGSSGNAQFKYVNSKYLTTTSDLTFLVAYSSFAKSAGDFLSLLETLLSKIRTGYATSLGVENRINKITNDQRRQKQMNKDELSRNNIQRCLEILTGNEFNVLQANLQCSSIILLKAMQNESNVPQANRETVKRQIETLTGKCSWSDKIILDKLLEGLDSASIVSEFRINSGIVKLKAEWLVRQISLIKKVLGILSNYVLTDRFSSQGKAQIEGILNNTDYYYGTPGSIGGEYLEDHYKEGDVDDEGLARDRSSGGDYKEGEGDVDDEGYYSE